MNFIIKILICTKICFSVTKLLEMQTLANFTLKNWLDLNRFTILLIEDLEQ